MARVKITKGFVKEVRVPTVGRIEIMDDTRGVKDTAPPGFGLRVTASGVKSYFMLYRFAGERRRFTVGTTHEFTPKEARDAAWDARGDIKSGVDPVDKRRQQRESSKAEREARRRRRQDTFEATAKDFIQKYAKKKHKRPEQTQWTIEKYVYPEWKTRPILDIGKRDVLDLLDKIAEENGGATSDRVFATIRKLFNWWADRDDDRVSPCANVKSDFKSKPRDRHLVDNEIKPVWMGSAIMGYPYGYLIQVCLLTGQRRAEVAEMRWDQLDFDKPVWSLTAADTKASRPHLVPLSPQVVKILKAIHKDEEGGGKYVFSTTNGERPISGFSKYKRTLDGKVGIAPWRLHDLRRTCATHLAELGTADIVIGAVLNHSPKGITAQVYNKYSYYQEKRRALSAWAGKVDRLVFGKKTGKVVKLRA